MARYDASDDEMPKYSWHVALDPDHPDWPWIRVGRGDLPRPEDPAVIAVRLGLVRGRLVCTGLRIGAESGEEPYEVTSRMLRDVRLGNVLRAIREHHIHPLLSAKIEGYLEGKSLGEVMAEKAEPLQVRRGRKGLAAEELRRTADVYLKARAEGSNRPLAVAAVVLDLDPSTVWRRLQNAWERWPDMKPKEGGKS